MLGWILFLIVLALIIYISYRAFKEPDTKPSNVAFSGNRPPVRTTNLREPKPQARTTIKYKHTVYTGYGSEEQEYDLSEGVVETSSEFVEDVVEDIIEETLNHAFHGGSCCTEVEYDDCGGDDGCDCDCDCDDD